MQSLGLLLFQKLLQLLKRIQLKAKALDQVRKPMRLGADGHTCVVMHIVLGHALFAAVERQHAYATSRFDLLSACAAWAFVDIVKWSHQHACRTVGVIRHHRVGHPGAGVAFWATASMTSTSRPCSRFDLSRGHSTQVCLCGYGFTNRIGF